MTEFEAPPEIERLEAPSAELFYREYVDRNRPVIVTGVADKWPAFTKWTPEYLVAKGGDSVVKVRYDAEGDHQRFYTPEGGINEEMPFGQLVAGLTADPPDTRYYMSEFSVAQISPELAADLDCVPYLERGHPVFFLGRRSFTPQHYHGNHEAFLCQVRGTKKIAMFPPRQFRCFYAYPWYSTLLNFARVDERAPDLARFPRFARAKGTTVTLHPGEMLFIPIHWWHSVGSVDEGFGISATFFWPAKRKNYVFPFPALQVYGHHLFAPGSLKGWARKAGRKVKRLVVGRAAATGA